MNYYELSLPVDGFLGSDSEYIEDSDPPRLRIFHFELADWFGEDIVKCRREFGVTRRLAEALESSGLTGFALRPMKVTLSEEGKDIFKWKGRDEADLPDLAWLYVTGAVPGDDFAISPQSGMLVVSKPALSLLERFELFDTTIQDYKL